MKTIAAPADVRHKAGAAAVLGAVVALAAACGSQSDAGRPADPGPQTSQPVSSLSIRVIPTPGATAQHWTLTCGSAAGGTLPHPEAACATFAHARYPFAPVPHGIMCAMIDSGQQAASIVGTWEGERVAAIFSRQDDCWTARWYKIWKILGQVNPGGPMIPASGEPPSG